MIDLTARSAFDYDRSYWRGWDEAWAMSKIQSRGWAWVAFACGFLMGIGGVVMIW